MTKEKIREKQINEKKSCLSKLGAKILSKGAMIFSSSWIAILTILKGLGKVHLEENEIIMSGVMITAVWTPTFLSILADKFTTGEHKGRCA